MALARGVEGVSSQTRHDGSCESDSLKKDEGLVKGACHAHGCGDAHGLHMSNAGCLVTSETDVKREQLGTSHDYPFLLGLWCAHLQWRL